MGSCKPLLLLANKPAIHHSLDVLLGAAVDATVVVLGPGGEPIQETIAGMLAAIAWNRDPEGDMAGSVRIGLAALPADCTGVLIHLADYPLVILSTVKTICRAHTQSPQTIIIPTFQGRQGHPTLFPQAILAELADGVTLRDIVRKDPTRVTRLPVNDEGILLDMDTPADYEALRQRIL